MIIVRILGLVVVGTVWWGCLVLVAWWLAGFHSGRGRNSGALLWFPAITTDKAYIPPSETIRRRLKEGEPGRYTGLLPAWRLIAALAAVPFAVLVYWGLHALGVLPWWPF